MTIWKLVISEILHRKINFALGVISVMVASASFIGSVTLLRIHDFRTGQILAWPKRGRVGQKNDRA